MTAEAKTHIRHDRPRMAARDLADYIKGIIGNKYFVGPLFHTSIRRPPREASRVSGVARSSLAICPKRPPNPG